MLFGEIGTLYTIFGAVQRNYCTLYWGRGKTVGANPLLCLWSYTLFEQTRGNIITELSILLN